MTLHSENNQLISQDKIRRILDAIEAKDMAAVMANFDAHAELIDPHYPNPHMKGRDEILEGLTWGFKSLKSFGFSIEHYFESTDKTSAVVEVATAHVLPNGIKLNFPQILVFEMKDDKIVRLRAYQPYGPHGINKLVLGVTRLLKKIGF